MNGWVEGKELAFCEHTTSVTGAFHLGGWVGGLSGWVEKEKAVGVRCCETWVGGWVGGGDACV